MGVIIQFESHRVELPCMSVSPGTRYQRFPSISDDDTRRRNRIVRSAEYLGKEALQQQILTNFDAALFAASPGFEAGVRSVQILLDDSYQSWQHRGNQRPSAATLDRFPSGGNT
jgi:hypothetical protein